MSAKRVLVIGICGVCVATSAFAGSVPLAGSPGDASSLAPIGDICPTFSWGEVEGAKSYELVVYRIGEDVEEATPVLRQTLAGSVGSWTPSLDRCLERGGKYAWSVQALTPDGGRTSWSEASLFEISPELSIREVERALQVLQRYLGVEDDLAEETGRAPVAAHPVGSAALRGSRQPSNPRGSAPEALLEPGLSASLDAPSPAVPTVLPSDYALSIDGDFDLGRFVFKDGVPFLHNYDGASSDGRNTALGASALQSVTPESVQPWSGLYNTAFGYQALRDNSEGSFNTAVGHNALIKTSTGVNNTGVGHGTLSTNETGDENTAVGYDAAALTTGSLNAALGAGALGSNMSGWRNTAVGAYAAFGFSDAGPVTGSENTAVGHASLYFNSTGSFNTAVGVFALQNNDTGNDNTAVGHRANNWGTEGTANTAVGTSALHRNTASSNTAVGYKAMFGFDQQEPPVPTTGEENTAVGFRALEQVTTGSENTAIGQQTLRDNLVGSHNVALGDRAGFNITGSSNIMINHPGVAGEENRLRIGLCEFDPGPAADNARCLKQVNIKGIYDKTLSGAQHAVYINDDGQLGKQASSRRYKQEIQPIGSGSERLLDLRPVSFRFKGTGADQPVYFGLIAEEVEQIFPELVGRDADGRADSVRYELLSSLLVNELQRQEREIGMLRRRHSSLRAQLLGLLLVGGAALVVGRAGLGRG